MADNLRVTLPLVNRAQVVDPKSNAANIPQFNLQDITKVMKPAPEAELLMQNNGLLEEETASSILLDLLKDPSVTVSFLRNISMLQEIIGLIPGQTQPLTGEIEQMFQQLMLNPEDLASEMLQQESAATRFRGDVFDVLRGLLDQNPQNRQVLQSVLDVLKSVNLYLTKRDVLDAVSNSLEYLSKSLSPSKTLSGKLMELAQQFRAGGSDEKFTELKNAALALFSEVEESILFSSKMAKMQSIAVYNLSRFNGGVDHLEVALERLLSLLPSDEQKEQFLSGMMRLLTQPEESAGRQTRVLDLLSEIITRQAGSEEVAKQGSTEQLNKIIQSLLSSPSNFTPLLHFILPLQYENVQSFMEMWINPNGEEDDPRATDRSQTSLHFLMVFDIGGVGRFEMELFVRDKTIDMALFCPTAFTEVFESARSDINRCLRGLDYQFGDIRIDGLERSRSLIEVFRALPYRRTGLDVKI